MNQHSTDTFIFLSEAPFRRYIWFTECWIWTWRPWISKRVWYDVLNHPKHIWGFYLCWAVLYFYGEPRVQVLKSKLELPQFPFRFLNNKVSVFVLQFSAKWFQFQFLFWKAIPVWIQLELPHFPFRLLIINYNAWVNQPPWLHQSCFGWWAIHPSTLGWPTTCNPSSSSPSCIFGGPNTLVSCVSRSNGH